MSRAGISFERLRTEMMAEEGFREEYEKLRPRYEVIEQIIEARKEQHMTQEELAGRIGTKKSNVSRLERGNYNPSLDFLIRVAKALGKELVIEMK